MHKVFLLLIFKEGVEFDYRFLTDLKMIEDEKSGNTYKLFASLEKVC